MAKGGFYNEKLSSILKQICLFSCFILSIQSILVGLDIISGAYYRVNEIYIPISILWIVIGVGQYLNYNNKKNSPLSIILIHIVCFIHIFLISGISSPVLLLWVVLFIKTYDSFGKKGLWYSILSYVITIFIYISLFINNIDQFEPNVAAIFNLIIVIMIGIFSSNIMDIKSANNIALKNSHIQEKWLHERTMTIINNIADAIVSTDNNGIIKIYNAAFLNILDTNSNLSGKQIDSILPLSDDDKNKISIFSIMQSSNKVVINDKLSFFYTDADSIRLEITISPIKSTFTNRINENNGYVMIIRDITKAKNLDEERDEFISVVSHELRTPITISEGTISNVQLMMKRDDIPKQKLSQAVDVAHDQVLYLARMVNDLSTLSRAERGVASEKEHISVKDMLEKIYKSYQPEAIQRRLSLNLDVAPNIGFVDVSRLYIEEMIQNFVTNALKYTKEGSVTISAAKDSNKIEISVKDTGIGISKHDQSKIFNKFYRSEDYRTRETTGTGLGLYIAAKLASKLGTKIEFSSRLNYGSTFSFRLPASKIKK